MIRIASTNEAIQRADVGRLSQHERARVRNYLDLGYSPERVAELQGVPVEAVRAMKRREWI